MKRAVFLILVCAMLAGVTGCGSKRPDRAVDGTAWGEDWIMLGSALGIEEPGHGLTLRDDKAARNMSYTAWSIGEPQSYVNAAGEDAVRYDAQLVVLVTAAESAEDAQMYVDDWLALAGENYTVTDTAQQTCNGQEYTVVTYTFPSAASPFARGVSAFATFGSWAVSAEFACQETFEEDAWEILSDVLDHCHYAPEE